jgi:uncharacterized membrane protein YeaQ/YmgE (transglycosylase-associated protein family)
MARLIKLEVAPMTYSKAAKMVDENSSLVIRWWRSTTAQGVALGAVLGPGGALLSFLLSSKPKRAERTFGTLKGSVATSLVILIVGACVALAIYAF